MGQALLPSQFCRLRDLTTINNNRLVSLEAKFDILVEHMPDVHKNTKPVNKLTPVAPGIVAEQKGNHISYGDIKDDLKKACIKLHE